MCPVSKKNSQAGFSLVELMVVVAIIGILAAIAIPNMQKYMAKSRQAEAKSNLSSVYTSEKAFLAEYGGYYGGFKVIGYSPEGKMRYNIGFSAVGALPSGYNGTLPAPNTFAALTYCGSSTVANAAVPASGCLVIGGFNNLLPGAITAATTANTTFLAQARSRLLSNTEDIWTIDQNKVVSNAVNGIN